MTSPSEPITVYLSRRQCDQFGIDYKTCVIERESPDVTPEADCFGIRRDTILGTNTGYSPSMREAINKAAMLGGRAWAPLNGNTRVYLVPREPFHGWFSACALPADEEEDAEPS